MESQKKHDQHIFRLAVGFLLDSKKDGEKVITNEMLQTYFHPVRPRTVQGIYQHLLESAQNANMKAGVIGGSIDGIQNLRKVLLGFDPKKVVGKYRNAPKLILDEIKRTLKPDSKINSKPSGLWWKYCWTILDGAKFMIQFKDAKDFYRWVGIFYNDDRARPALPLLLKEQIYGYGFALACDFLKELGYVKFAKPDTHLREIFTKLDLCTKKASDFDLLEAIIRVAVNCNVTPYHADKVFWLIGSGNFYNHNLKMGKRRQKFISYCRRHS